MDFFWRIFDLLFEVSFFLKETSKFMLVDTHCHLNFSHFDKDREEVIKRAQKEKILMIIASSNFSLSQKAIEIAQNHQGVFAAVGLHPLNLKKSSKKEKFNQKNLEDILEENFNFEKYKKLASKEKVVALGETGLDFYKMPKTKKQKEILKSQQKEVFLKQLKLAQELKLPLILHSRKAHQEILEILTFEIEKKKKEIKGVIHSFVGNLIELKKYLKLGFYIGFSGIIFKKIEGINFEKIIKITPLERILLETDAPFLPPPKAEKKRNEPVFLKSIAKKIAKIKKISFEKLAYFTSKNAQTLFHLKRA